jgi:hypothetical protein
MFGIMILSGFLSTMNVWADKLDDVRLSLNDAYMTFLMAGWMILFMALLYGDRGIAILAAVLVIIMIWCIRTQAFITERQFLLGMIPHHSMAVLMSKQLKKRENNIQSFLQEIINTQEKEIKFMKDVLST